VPNWDFGKSHLGYELLARRPNVEVVQYSGLRYTDLVSPYLVLWVGGSHHVSHCDLSRPVPNGHALMFCPRPVRQDRVADMVPRESLVIWFG